MDLPIDLPKLKTITIGDHAFETGEVTELSGSKYGVSMNPDLPSLETLNLGQVVFSGKLKIGSLTMKS